MCDEICPIRHAYPNLVPPEPPIEKSARFKVVDSKSNDPIELDEVSVNGSPAEFTFKNGWVSASFMAPKDSDDVFLALKKDGYIDFA